MSWNTLKRSIGSIFADRTPVEQPKYCSLCGEELVVTRKQTAYDPITGNAQKVTIETKCPDFRWIYNGTYLFTGEHDFISNGHYRHSVTVRVKDGEE